MIDLTKAKKAFKEYVSNFDLNDDRVKLKITHTYGVVDASIDLGKRLKLSEEDYELSQLIALLHDIGRFRQSKVMGKVFDKADLNCFDHAKEGCKILFEENLIRKFIDDDKYDEIIYKSILNHNKYKLDENLTGKILLHSKLIRDNDKTDNFRVKATEKLVTLLGTDDMNAIENDTISDKIYNDFINEKQLLIQDRKTYLDSWVSYISFIFDYNFDEALLYLKENDKVNVLFNRINYKNPETKNKIENMRKVANNFIDKRTSHIK